MSQVLDNEPKSCARIAPVLLETRRLRAMNIHEHARLVQAIMLNFPEIYDEPSVPNIAALFGNQRHIENV
jgi:hypothetical protein